MDIGRRRGGWQPDLPDHRDYTPQRPVVLKVLRHLKPNPEHEGTPPVIDWRNYCSAIEDQGNLPTSCAHACVALIQYFDRRCKGRNIRPSRLFIHSNAERLQQQPADHSVSLRAVLKALVCFGAPAEDYWPYRAATLRRRATPFTFGVARKLRNIHYVRLDARHQTGKETLEVARRFLAAGFPFVIGFPVSSAVNQSAEIPFPTVFDSIRTGMAVLAVGYDDNRRIHSDKGAILIRGSWGKEWGDQGYGWLPYTYLRDRLAADAWTVLKRSWLKSGELSRPQV